MKRLLRIVKGLALLFGAGLMFCAFLRWQGLLLFPQEAAPGTWEVFGVDVSSYQGEVDWPTLAEQGVRFAFCKATEGSGHVDPTFQQNWQGAQEAGVLVGAYHFFSYDSPGETQAENFIAQVPVTAGTLPPVVDIEFYGEHDLDPPSKEKAWAILRPLLERLEEHYGVKPILYATYRSYKLYLAGEAEGYPLWITLPIVGPLDKPWTFWQYSHSARLEGYVGKEERIDLDVFRGSMEELERMTLPVREIQQDSDDEGEFTVERYFEDSNVVWLWADIHGKVENLLQVSDFANHTGYHELDDQPEKVSLYTKDELDGICVETFSSEPGELTKTHVLITGQREGQYVHQELLLDLRVFGFYYSGVGWLESADANFDGESDLLLFCGGNRGCGYYALLLWNEGESEYIYEPSFSDVSSPVVDVEHQIVWGGGDPGYSYWYHAYELIDGVYVRTHTLVSGRIASVPGTVYCEEYEGDTQVGRIEFEGDFYAAVEYYAALEQAWEGWSWCDLRAFYRYG